MEALERLLEHSITSRMNIRCPVFTLLLQILPTSSLAIDTTSPSSLFQNQDTTPNTTLLFQLQLSNLTDSYYVECDRVTSPPPPELNPSHCLDAIPIICSKLTQTPPSHLMRREWIWVELPGCSLGYYLPETSGGVIPSVEECKRDIYGLIIERCGFKSHYNVGSINVAQLPKEDRPGLPMTEGYLRYVMAPERL